MVMGNVTNEYYAALQAVADDEGLSLREGYRLLREMLEELCRSQLTDSSLQMTDLSARINYVAARLGLTAAEQNRLHTVRLTANALLNGEPKEVDREDLLRDVKSMAFLVRRLTGEEVPPLLRQRLPLHDSTWQVQPLGIGRIKQLGVEFEYADGHYLYVRPTDRPAGEELWKVRYRVPQVNEEFNATCERLWRHARLNLLDVTVDVNGVLTPMFLILEPDYLMDISALAECFKEYGHHPANYLYARLRPSENSRAILVGNIANLFLDEWVHSPSDPDYLTCMRKAFRQYALELTACPDLRDAAVEREFFAECRKQFLHIGQTVRQTFAEPGYALDQRDAVLEPSYICEALGLQGRLDYMQCSMEAFIEMKSGKADEYSLRGRVEPKENHRVQMLLYQAVLEYALGRDHHNVKPYLLYTRYPLLYPARASWAMLRRVMDVRNRIVEREYGVQLRNSVSYTEQVLADICPDTLNEKGLKGVLWTRYLMPPIDRLSQRLKQLSPLERSYFYTIYNFITKELYTSKSGDIGHEGCVGAASLWHATLDEKLEAGEMLCDLNLTVNEAARLEHPYVELQQPQEQVADVRFIPNFRVGDAVLLYERNRTTDNVTNRLVVKGGIESMEGGRIVLRLKAPQQSRRVLPPDSRYAIEHDATLDSSLRCMYQGLALFLHAPSLRRQWLLGERPSGFDHTLDREIAAAPDDFQRIALKAEAARDCFLLVGPPGTGKTSRALRTMVENFHAKGNRLLLLSYTNRAVDEMCKSLASITPAIDFIRIGSELSCEETWRPYLMEAVLSSCTNRKEVAARLERCRVYVGTVATLSARSDLFRLMHFDVALVDESTQILEPQLLPLLAATDGEGREAIAKFVLIGDYKQLPAVVMQSEEQSEVCDEALRNIGMRNLKDSLFERLYRRLKLEGADDVSRGFDMLCRQGRMNPEVALFPNQAFYEGKLQPVGLPHQQGELTLCPQLAGSPLADLLVRRVAFIPAQPEPATSSCKVNHDEAAVVARIAQAVYEQYRLTEGFDSLRTLGVIAPYRSQVALIRSALSATGIEPLNHILVDTVERFQGSERDVIIYSFCVNRLRQLRFLANLTEEDGVVVDRKLNVALTRSRKQLFLTGVSHLLKENPIYAALLEQTETCIL